MFVDYRADVLHSKPLPRGGLMYEQYRVRIHNAPSEFTLRIEWPSALAANRRGILTRLPLEAGGIWLLVVNLAPMLCSFDASIATRLRSSLYIDPPNMFALMQVQRDMPYPMSDPKL